MIFSFVVNPFKLEAMSNMKPVSEASIFFFLKCASPNKTFSQVLRAPSASIHAFPTPKKI